jgi:hypothetical protein
MNKKLLRTLTMALTILMGVSTYAGVIPKVELNGTKLLIKESPIEKNGTTYVPLRTVENLGAKVTWNNETQTATITHGYNTIEQRIGSNTALVNSKSVSVPAPAIKHNGTTYIPIRFISETLGATIERDQKENSINIVYEMPKDGNQKYDQFGRMIRKDNLPKNAASYSSIIQGVPNDLYEMQFEYQIGKNAANLVEGRHYKRPVTMIQDSWYNESNVALWKNKCEEYLDLMLNVDYRTINYNWAEKMAALTCQTGLDENYYNRNLKRAKEYVDYVKTNQLIIEGDYYVEPSVTYMTHGGVYMRSWVKFKGNKDFRLFEDSYDNKGNTWYEGYTDISLGSQKGGEQGNELVVKNSSVGDPGRKLLVK